MSGTLHTPLGIFFLKSMPCDETSTLMISHAISHQPSPMERHRTIQDGSFSLTARRNPKHQALAQRPLPKKSDSEQAVVSIKRQCPQQVYSTRASLLQKGNGLAHTIASRDDGKTPGYPNPGKLVLQSRGQSQGTVIL